MFRPQKSQYKEIFKKIIYERNLFHLSTSNVLHFAQKRNSLQFYDRNPYKTVSKQEKHPADHYKFIYEIKSINERLSRENRFYLFAAIDSINF